jgi:2-polyprenyl-6-methoxyphenol hydroxylase-like FAD-dependent oxidoreductase
MAAVTADVVLASASPSVPRSAAHISTLQRAGGGYWMLLHPLDGDAGATSGYRVIFGAPGRPAPARDAPVTPDEVATALSAVHGPETVLGRLRWGTRFSDASRQLTASRHGRVLFAGDAAHIHPPIGGQGLNLGVQDAVNLGWKLAATVANRALDGLLDSYHAERHPVAARVLATVRAQGVIMNPAPDADDVRALRDIVADLARLPDGNRHLAGLMTGLAIRYDLGDDDPLVGRRMIDLSLDTADASRP